MRSAMPAAEQVRRRLTVLTQRPQVAVHLIRRPPADQLGSQVFQGIGQPGQLLGADSTVELCGVAAVV
jgi:hypothetical protein